MGEPGIIQIEQYQEIQKVPEFFRRIQSSTECYDPLVVSIGPYHHGKPELEAMEEHKRSMANIFCQNDLQGMLKKVDRVARGAKKFYPDGSTTLFNDENFAKMMVVDGCFILQFISCFLESKDTGMKPHVEGLVIRDLFLLENQLPFSVLKALNEFSQTNKKNDNIVKFLEKVRRVSIKEPESVDSNNFPQVLHLLELYHTQFTKPWPKRLRKTSNEDGWYCYRSARELQNVGIHFKPSGSALFTDVKYKSYFFGGFVWLPPIVIDDATKSLLLNLAAYENCPSTLNNDLAISSYIVFMDSLIDNTEDVKELRRKGILLNSMGSDQDVADMFNEISKYLVLHQNAFADVRDGINQRYQNRLTKWMTEWLSTHFSSPWTILAFAGAILGLFLTAIQTYLTVYPPE